MDQSKKYIECKKRNEQQLLYIRQLESQIAKAQQIVQEIHSSTSKSRKYYEQYRHLTDEQRGYQQKLSTKSDSFTISELKPSHAISASGKRDLSKLLTATPEQICNKLEQLIISQKNSGQAPSADELSNMQQMVSKLPYSSNKEKYNDFIQHLIEDLNKIKHNRIQKYNNIRVSHDDMSRDKEDMIREYHVHRINKVQELETRREQLDVECKEAEAALTRRVKELYADPQIQYALTKSIRIKAVNHQMQTEFSSMKTQIEELAEQIQTIEGQTEFVINQHLENMLQRITSKHDDVQTLLTANKTYRKSLKTQSNKAKQDVQKEMDALFEKINAAKQKIESKVDHQSNLESKKSLKDDIDYNSNKLLEAKNAVSPYSLISTLQLFKNLIDSIRSIDAYENDSTVEVSSEIKQTLEKLMNNWTSSNNDVPMDIPRHHDEVDSLIQSIDTIRLQIQHKERDNVDKAEKLLRSKLASREKIDRDIQHVQAALEERDLMRKVGSDFVVEDKNFNDWMTELDELKEIKNHS